MKGLRVIKKYQNRRLYDTATSTYIVLEDIKQIIVDGEVVQVVDAKTNKDITRHVLLQIILEEEISGHPIFSNEFLVQIIKFYGKAFQKAFTPFLDYGMDMFCKMQSQFYDQMKAASGKDKLSEVFNSWKDFIQDNAPELEQGIKECIQGSTNAFLKMQEQMHNQSSKMFNYFKFPFDYMKKK